jgi:tRNA pseudouridine55 synthase
LDNFNGAIVIDKPAGWTSHDVVNKVRRLTGIRKVGHLGTLDPSATGVLPLLIGRATRLAQYFGKADKRYEGVVRFGYATDTYDAEGKAVTAEAPVSLDCDQLNAALDPFRGRIRQMPPPVSAKKIGGVPAYKLVRQNKPVQLDSVEVEVFSIEILSCAGNEAALRVHCAGGTYVRSIAHDLGTAMGCGAFLKNLRRTASGCFDLSMARTLEQLAEDVPGALIPGAELLPEFPAEIVDATTAGFIRQGRDFRVSPFRSRDARFVKAVSGDGELLAIGEIILPNLYHPILVL